MTFIPPIEEIFHGRATLPSPTADHHPHLPSTPVVVPRPPNATPLDEVPFTPKYGLSKVCPECRERKPLDSDHWYRQKAFRNVPHDDGEDQWVTREKVDVPSTYCKACTSKRNAAAAKVRRALAKLPPEEREMIRSRTMKGPCGVCGKESRSRRFIRAYGVGACSNCDALLKACSHDAATARDFWLKLFKHIGDEERIQRQVLARTNRLVVPYHDYNPDWPQGHRMNHAVCLSQEIAWKGVWRFLKNHDAVTHDATHPPETSSEG